MLGQFENLLLVHREVAAQAEIDRVQRLTTADRMVGKVLGEVLAGFLVFREPVTGPGLSQFFGPGPELCFQVGVVRSRRHRWPSWPMIAASGRLWLVPG